MRCIFLLLLTGFCAGCQIAEPETGITLLPTIYEFRESNRPVVSTLKVGSSVRFLDLGVTITFEKVIEDSRCPRGWMCFWEGDGVVKLVIQSTKSGAQLCTLHTALYPKSIVLQTLLIELKELTPYPEHDVQIDPNSYLLTLEIRPVIVRKELLQHSGVSEVPLRSGAQGEIEVRDIRQRVH